ncbi:MAG: cyclic nucleotide-binding domain-containing protein [Gammaproteobacteria bacterium]|nr:cyclic nucleotide-binding domain-containing protein [Gammaproteobacteria bacterium]
MNLNDLTSLPTLSLLNDAELQQLISLGHEVLVAPGETIVEEGSTAASFFVLVKGQVEVTKGTKKIAELGP